jgi:hypothetical protein
MRIRKKDTRDCRRWTGKAWTAVDASECECKPACAMPCMHHQTHARPACLERRVGETAGTPRMVDRQPQKPAVAQKCVATSSKQLKKNIDTSNQ